MNVDNLIQQVMSDKKQSLIYTIYLMAFFLFPFVICAFVVSGTSNAGFNVVLTAILNMCFAAEAYYIVNNSKTPIAVSYRLSSFMSA
jgi:nitrate reductase NapE component